MRAFTKAKIGNLRSAITDINEIIKIDPDYAAAYAQKGYIFKQKKEYKKAIKEFEIAIELFSKKSMLDKVKLLQKEINNIQQEIQNTPWWNKQIF
jgi:Tfp pilus assembly protein PilF